MSTEPLFVDTMENLRLRLRLDGVADKGAVIAIEEAVGKARIGFFDALGADRCNEIRGTALEDNPVSSEQIDRSRAAQCEANWVRMLLLRSMPTLIMGSPKVQQTWNEESIAREAGRETEAEIERLKQDIDQALAALGTGTIESDLKVTTIEADTDPPRPGASIGLAVSLG